MMDAAHNQNMILQLLRLGSLDLEGLLPWSSNYTFLVRVCPNTAVSQALNLSNTDELTEVQSVYKPSRGERPLWDFPSGTLCNREHAAYLVSAALGWNLVPPTILRDGPHGIGSLQLFIEHDPDLHYFAIEGDPDFAEQLQKIVLFDIIINNADRKAGHVLIEENSSPDRLWAIDHGICFHTDPKLRTVIWEFAGQPIPEPLLADLHTLKDNLAINKNNLNTQLQDALSQQELFTFQRRLDNLIEKGIFNIPGAGRHYPWPPV